MDTYSQALGYGFWCNKKCAQRKMAAGIPPLGARRATKAQEAASDVLLAQTAAQASASQQERRTKTSWSPLAVAGVVTAGLVGIALMVVIVKKAQK